MPVDRADKPLWTCPACGHQFVTPRLYHSCGRFSADALFGRQDHLRKPARVKSGRRQERA